MSEKERGWRLTSVARRTVRVRSPMRMPFRPAQAMSVTLGSWYTTKPYLQDTFQHHKADFIHIFLILCRRAPPDKSHLTMVC